MMFPVPNGLLMKVTVIPPTTASAGQRHLAEQLPAGAELERVVEDAQDRRHGAARRAGANSSGAPIVRGIVTRSRAARWRQDPPIATTMNAVATAMPPPRGIGRLLTRR